MSSVRKNTCKLMDLAAEGMVSWRTIAEMALHWMSESDVTEMMEANELLWDEDEEE